MRTAINNPFIPLIVRTVLTCVLDDAQTRAFRLEENKFNNAHKYEFWEDDPLGNNTIIGLIHYFPKDGKEFFTLDWTAPDCFDFGSDIYTENRRFDVRISKEVFDYALSLLMPCVIRKAA